MRGASGAWVRVQGGLLDSCLASSAQERSGDEEGGGTGTKSRGRGHDCPPLAALRAMWQRLFRFSGDRRAPPTPARAARPRQRSGLSRAPTRSMRTRRRNARLGTGSMVMTTVESASHTFATVRIILSAPLLLEQVVLRDQDIFTSRPFGHQATARDALPHRHIKPSAVGASLAAGDGFSEAEVGVSNHMKRTGARMRRQAGFMRRPRYQVSCRNTACTVLRPTLTSRGSRNEGGRWLHSGGVQGHPSKPESIRWKAVRWPGSLAIPSA